MMLFAGSSHIYRLDRTLWVLGTQYCAATEGRQWWCQPVPVTKDNNSSHESLLIPGVHQYGSRKADISNQHAGHGQRTRSFGGC